MPQAEFTSAEDVKSNWVPKRARALGAALERGAYTISDENKEKAEFNLGKNVM